MNIDNFEKQAQSEFDRYRPEVNTDEVWENIEPHLKKKRKRRPFLFFFWGLGIGLLMVLLWMKFSPDDTVQGSNTAITTLAPEPAEANAPEKNSGVANLSTDTETSKITGVDAKILMQKGVSRNTNSLLKTAQDQVILNEYNDENRPEQQSSNDLTSIQATSSTTKNPTIEPQTSIPQTLDAIPIEGNQNLTLLPDQKPDSTVNIAFDAETSRTPKETSVQGSEKKKKNSTPDAKSKTKAKKMGRTRPHKRKASKQTLSIHTGLVLPLKVLQPNDRVETNDGLLANRKASEKTLEAFSVSLHYTYATKKGLLFRGGFDYRRLNEKFLVRYSEKETKIVTGVLTQTVNTSGQVISTTTGPKEVTTTTIYSNVAYNSYQFLNLPLGMGFQKINKKSQWEIAGGMDLNLWFHFNGNLYNAYGEAVALSKSKYPDVYKRNTGLGMWASYGYSRNLSRNIRWQLAAKVNLPFQQITSDQYPLIQKYYTIGLQGGLIFNLIKEPKSKHKKRQRTQD